MPVHTRTHWVDDVFAADKLHGQFEALRGIGAPISSDSTMELQWAKITHDLGVCDAD